MCLSGADMACILLVMLWTLSRIDATEGWNLSLGWKWNVVKFYTVDL